ncbi:MAG TPA: hypothetical protein VF316_03385, partial [Polyangiaceae bacterium]
MQPETGRMIAEILAAHPVSETARPAAPIPPSAPEAARRVRPALSQRVYRASRYLEKIPGAIQGQSGDLQTWGAALKIVRGFSLPPEVALDLLIAEYSPRCEPPWSDKELRHKVESAAKASLPDGFLLGDEGGARRPNLGGHPIGMPAADAAIANLHEHAVRRRMQAPAADGFELTDTG